jgi:hypothetical protein
MERTPDSTRWQKAKRAVESVTFRAIDSYQLADMTMPRIAVALSCFLIASSTFAQQRNTVSVFAVTGGNAGGAKIDATFAASFERRLGDRFSAELTASSERARRVVEVFSTTSQPAYATSRRTSIRSI